MLQWKVKISEGDFKPKYPSQHHNPSFIYNFKLHCLTSNSYQNKANLPSGSRSRSKECGVTIVRALVVLLEWRPCLPAGFRFRRSCMHSRFSTTKVNIPVWTIYNIYISLLYPIIPVLVDFAIECEAEALSKSSETH